MDSDLAPIVEYFLAHEPCTSRRRNRSFGSSLSITKSSSSTTKRSWTSEPLSSDVEAVPVAVVIVRGCGRVWGPGQTFFIRFRGNLELSSIVKWVRGRIPSLSRWSLVYLLDLERILSSPCSASTHLYYLQLTDD